MSLRPSLAQCLSEPQFPHLCKEAGDLLTCRLCPCQASPESEEGPGAGEGVASDGIRRQPQSPHCPLERGPGLPLIYSHEDLSAVLCPPPPITSAELGHRCFGNQGSETGRFSPAPRMASPVRCTGGQAESEVRWPLGSERISVPVGSSAECGEEVMPTTERHWEEACGHLPQVPPADSTPKTAWVPGFVSSASRSVVRSRGGGFCWNTCESLLGAFSSLTPVKSAGWAP